MCSETQNLLPLFSLLTRDNADENDNRLADSPVCKMGCGDAFIDHDGAVWPCGRLPIVLGNAREERFEDLWLGSKKRKDLTEIRWGELPECSACEDTGWMEIKCPLGCKESK